MKYDDDLFSITPVLNSGEIQIFCQQVLFAKVVFSAGFVLTNSASINSNTGRFSDLVKFLETVL